MNKLIIKFITFLLLLSTFFTFTVAPALAAVTYLYDANGNMTSDGTNCYTYNEENDLTQVKNCTSNQLVAEYVYDDEGNRGIQKIYQNGVLSKTVYTPTKSYETTQMASGGAIQNTTYYLIDGQIAARKNPDGTKTYYHNDNLNSANVLTDQNGQLVEKTTYYPFGEIQSGGTQSKFLYTGQKQDSETGLDYYNARYYNPHIRRFTQPDDIIPELYNPQSLNKYSYVFNNPLRYTDPTGHQVAATYAAGGGAFIIDPIFGLLLIGGTAYASNKPFQSFVNSYISSQVKSQTLPLQLAFSAVKSITSQSKNTSSNTKNNNSSNTPKAPNQNPIQKIAPFVPPALQKAKDIADNIGKRFTPDQDALIQLAKDAQKNDVSLEDAKTLLQWAEEYDLPARGPEIHPGRPWGQFLHIHLGPVDHIFIK